MSHHRAAPLSADEARVLRAVEQDLTRSGAGPLRDPTHREDSLSRSQLVELGVSLLAIGLVTSLITLCVGPLLAIVVGAALLVAATVRSATSARVGHPRRR